MEAVMLLAGESTRMRPLTCTKPKPLLKILNKTILEHNLEQLEQNGIKDVVMVLGFLQDDIKRFLGKFNQFNFKFATQKEHLGTGHALLQTESLIKGEKFLVMNGDDFYHHEDIRKCLDNEMCATAKEVDNPERFGVFVVENGYVKNLIEKSQTPPSNLANTGLYILNKNIFDFLRKVEKSERNEFELTDAIVQMSKEHPVKCEITNNWIPIGYPWDLLTANEIKMKETENRIDTTASIDKNVTIKGNVRIGKNTVIKNGAYIEGPVIIGDNCTIGPNCYIRENSVIGDGSKVGNGSEVKNSIIGSNTNISHLSYVCDSIVGDNCNFGAGTIVANLRHDDKTIRSMVKDDLVDTSRRKFGVVMADYTKTGINTSIYPGVMIGPFSWTVPGISIKENLQPLTLLDENGKRQIDENRFDKNVIERIRFIKQLVSK